MVGKHTLSDAKAVHVPGSAIVLIQVPDRELTAAVLAVRFKYFRRRSLEDFDQSGIDAIVRSTACQPEDFE